MVACVLIANRGEIALRIVRTCRELGLETVVVHSTVDRDSEAARLADRTVQIGPAAARASYLNIPAIIEAAVASGADAIHPGYGFLSEDPDFAEVCESHGITFVGPPAALLARLGDKAAARATMAAAGLPVLPGSDGAVGSVAEARRAAGHVGYPLLVKAVAGGGGRGMAVARDAREFSRVYAETRARAQALFGDGRVYLERFVDSVRHVEVQILGDGRGGVVHLGERDCSVQRRNQKLLEETPAPRLPDALTAEMAAAAVRGARAVSYAGAGTFEFLVDADERFYFMEINCRLQVEHPVTEAVTGLDLVREQLAVAAGRPLSVRQADVQPRGAALECRINAEDPERAFAPTPGTLERFVPPGGPFTRVDSHAVAGLRVTPDYDPLLAKVTVWAPDRDQALARMDRALGELRVEGPGVRTTTPFLREVLAHPLFRDGKHTTSLVATMVRERGEARADAG